MRKRVLVVLRSYGQDARSWSAFCLVSFLAAYAQRRGTALSLVFLVVPVALTVGRHLGHQFRTYRVRLLPGYAGPHLAVAGTLTLGFASVVAIAFAAGSPQSNPRLFAGVAWLCANLGLLAGYSMFPAGFGIAVLGAALVSFAGFDAMSSFDYGSWRMLALNAAMTVAFFRHLSQPREEKVKIPGVAFSIGVPPSPAKLDSAMERYQRWIDAYMEPMPSRIGVALSARLRHVILCVSPPLPRRWFGFMAVGYVVFLLILGVYVPTFVGVSGHNSFRMMTPMVMVLACQGGLPRRRLQWLSMLPLRKGEMLLLYGAALMSSMVKFWAIFVIPSFIGAWARTMTSGSGGIPPVSPLLVSLAALPAILGMMTFLMSWGRSLGLVLLSAFLAEFVLGDLQEVFGDGLVYNITVLPIGLLLCWAAYARWHRVEFG